MNRRGFLGQCLALAASPALPRVAPGAAVLRFVPPTAAHLAKWGDFHELFERRMREVGRQYARGLDNLYEVFPR